MIANGITIRNFNQRWEDGAEFVRGTFSVTVSGVWDLTDLVFGDHTGIPAGRGLCFRLVPVVDYDCEVIWPEFRSGWSCRVSGLLDVSPAVFRMSSLPVGMRTARGGALSAQAIRRRENCCRCCRYNL